MPDASAWSTRKPSRRDGTCTHARQDRSSQSSVELIQYTPTTKKVYETPLLIVPPWINKYYILDLQPKNSMVRHLVEQGFSVFMISWKNPDASMDEIGIEDYMDLGLLEASDVVREIRETLP